MTANELLADMLTRNLEWVKNTLADFSDQDMLQRACPGANNAAWQIGHLTAAEWRMVNGVKPGAMPELPAGFAEKFSAETTKIDDSTKFPPKAELIAQFIKVRQATIAWTAALMPQDMDQPTPQRIRDWCPTAGHIAAMIPVHVAMHVGQIQVIRRKLGKPILF
jgi:hypothetical protein